MGKDRHLVIACGGTGGHFYPTLAIARRFVERGGRVTLLVSGGHAAEQAAVAARYDLAAVELDAIRLPRSPWSALAFPWRYLRCCRAASRKLRELRPDCVLGMGSFAAAPACQAVDPRVCPLYLHEGNVFMGRTNRLFARKARRIALSLPLADASQLHGTEAVVTGMPLREDILRAAAERPSVSDFLAGKGLDATRRRSTLLVFGGSQGARRLNELLVECLENPSAVWKGLQVIHLTGTDRNDGIRAAYRDAGVPAAVYRAESHIELCYLAADLVLCRAGAASICELALFGRPAVLVPLPTAADDHQTRNARLLEQRWAAICCPQDELTPGRLHAVLEDFRRRPDHWSSLGENMKAFASPDAAGRLVDMLME